VVDAALAQTTPVAAGAPSVARTRALGVTLGSTPLTGGREGRTVPIELVEWTIGSVRLVSIPGEAFHALGRAIEQRVLEGAVPEDGGAGASHVLLAGLTPEWHGYLPLPFGDGYEESTSYGRDAVAAIARALTG
jgi:hypothetical protein